MYRANSSDLGSPDVGQFTSELDFQFAHPPFRRGIHFGRIDAVTDISRTAQDREHCVVVFGRNRVQLVIVAACTGHRRRLECLRQRVDLVVGQVIPQRSQTDTVIVIDFTEAKEASPDDGFVEFFGFVPSRLRQQIAGNVLANELVIRNVVVERADQVVAIPPGVMDFVIPLVAVRFREPDNIHPVPRPVFAEMRRLQ